MVDATSNYEENLKLKEEILNTIEDGIFCLDDNWNFSYINSVTETLLLRCHHEIVGKNVWNEFCMAEKFQQQYEIVKETQTPLVFEEYYSPLEKWFHVRAYPSQSGVIVQFSDVTLNKQKQQESKKRTDYILHQSEKLSAIGQLAAGIAHEIRNPLTSLKGFLQLIKVDNSPKEEYFSIMNSEFDRIELILNELLLVAKPEKTQYEKCNIQNILQEVNTLLESQATLKDVRISMALEDYPIMVYCISNQIKQVFINLIKNGIDAMDKGGILYSSIKREKDEVIITIADQGEGIPEDKLKKLGQPFYSTKEKGTGLGLMVTYQIIENHQGSILVESKMNEGTTFTIKLPIN